MTSKELQEIEARAELATRGVWLHTFHHANFDLANVWGPDGDAIAETIHGNLAIGGEAIDNAAFIAHARTDVPALIAEIRRLLADLTEARNDAAFHADCRPNRQQAEAAMADAKATHDRWADEVVRREQAEATIASLREQLSSSQQLLRDAYAATETADGSWVEADLPTRVQSLNQQIATLREQLAAAQTLLSDVRPLLCDILKLASDIGAGNDYEAVAKVIDRIDAATQDRLGAANAPQRRADGPREPSTTPSSVEGPAGPRSLSFSEPCQ